MGISWGGFNALQVAAKQPPALKAIITLCSTDDRYADDIHYKGGCLLNENIGWGADHAVLFVAAAGPGDRRRQRWRDMWLSGWRTSPSCRRSGCGTRHRDAYWKRGSVCEDFSAIKAATLSIGGWHDAYKNTISRLVERHRGAGQRHRRPVDPQISAFAVPEPRIGFLQEALRWWDHWLKGADTGVEADPAYRGLCDGQRAARALARRAAGPLDRRTEMAVAGIEHGGSSLIAARAAAGHRRIAAELRPGRRRIFSLHLRAGTARRPARRRCAVGLLRPAAARARRSTCRRAGTPGPGRRRTGHRRTSRSGSATSIPTARRS